MWRPVRQFEERVVTPTHVRISYRVQRIERLELPWALAAAVLGLLWCALLVQAARGELDSEGVGAFVLTSLFFLSLGTIVARQALHHGDTHTYRSFIECTPTELRWKSGSGWEPMPDLVESRVALSKISRVEGTCGFIDGATVRSFHLCLEDGARLPCPELVEREVFDTL